MKTVVKSFSYRYFLIIVFLSLLVSIGGYYYYKYEKKLVSRQKYEELSAVAKLKVNHLVNWRQERLSEARFFSTNLPDIHNIVAIVKGKQTEQADEQLRSSLLRIMTNSRYENIFLLSENGNLLFSVNKEVVRIDDYSIRSAKKAVQDKVITIQDFYTCKIHHKIHFEIVAPVMDESKNIVATLVFQINPNMFLFPYLQEWPLLSRTAETLIIRKEGDSVLFINPVRHSTNAPLTMYLPLTNKETPAIQAVLGSEGVFEGVDYRGHKVLADVRKVPDSPWYMVSKVDLAEIYKELYQKAVFIFTITLGLILLVSLAIAWFYHYRQRNIYKELYLKRIELHESQEEFRATLYSIGDGVITTDKLGRVKQLNPVAEKLTGWKENDARGRMLEEVFQIINEDTRNKVESPVIKVLKKGLVVGLANHTLLISKNGNELPIADSGAPIKNRNGNIVGVVMVFRDQTEEREQQKELIKKEERFHSTLDNMLEGCQILNRDWEYVYINRAAEIHNKRPKEELMGKRYMDMWPGIEQTEVFRQIKKCLDDKIPYQMENEFVFPDGKSGWFKLSIQSIPEGVFILSVDITERKKASLELIAQKRFLQDLIENSGALIYVKDIDGKYELVNRKWEKVTGLSRDVVIGNTDEQLFPGEIGRNFRRMDVEVMNKKDKIEGEEVLEDSSGLRYFISTKFPLFNSDCQVSGICGVSTEITLLKQNESELIKSRAFIYSIIKNLPIGLAVNSITPAVEFEFVNDNFVKFYRITKEDLENPDAFWDAVYEDVEFRKQIKEKVLSDMDSNDPERMNWTEVPITRKGEDTRYITARNIPLPDKNMVISTVWDVTEQKLDKEEILTLNNKLNFLIFTLNQLTSAQSIAEVQQIITASARKLVGSDGCTFVLRDGNSCFYVDENSISPLWKGKKFPIAECICGWTMLNKKPAVIPDIFADDRIHLEAYKSTFVKSLVMVPINTSKPFGTIGNYWSRQHVPTDDEVKLIQTLADATARVYENIKLYEELENKVKEKTKELQEQVNELQRFREATIDRELRMKELKDEIKRLNSIDQKS
ncbi:MAG: hypothetical protein A2W97_10235 [Bacteroidetes bacterium GWE2_40_63]|nr:MAG: hypothetical protein A2W84_00195 [Bacteroidetes bacterium GWC2_40_13]OFX71180.1 MAG: hypothetical protein A2W96_15720 [Bacteroidetes bacterium GWD2_40_43]OFX92337.1 MAG: hypothetical protein A2W97_10235 [Bacteroidetes bacterium GWE2_40_63]OFY22940.1 MAG: hypothetical protein A2W88_04220 [Bacteroidetes bacterium GWF2_40_13]OFZ29970.1 MAG: hypothetical protein A2437_00750 [Bacteroidetes bacterium RIFOXYC2_FULL_40_12]HBO73988.1 hypothetical protein [Marinilabiliales bacterium]